MSCQENKKEICILFFVGLDEELIKGAAKCTVGLDDAKKEDENHRL